MAGIRGLRKPRIDKRKKAEATGEEAVRKLGFMRNDLQAYYLDSSWQPIFLTPPVAWLPFRELGLKHFYCRILLDF